MTKDQKKILAKVANGDCIGIYCEDCPLNDWHEEQYDLPVTDETNEDNLPKEVTEKAAQLLHDIQMDEQIDKFLKGNKDE